MIYASVLGVVSHSNDLRAGVFHPLPYITIPHESIFLFLYIPNMMRRFKPVGTEHWRERKNKIHALQQYRYQKAHGYDLNTRAPKLLRAERKICEIVQREEVLAAEINRGSLSPARSDEIQEEVLDLKNKYLVTEGEWKKIYNKIQSKALLRGMKLWRSYPQWWLHTALTEDCTANGGCCGRPCGCCRNRVLGTGRDLGVGHCTIECGCCQKTRGFALSDEAKDFLRSLRPLDRFTDSGYLRMMIKASFFGLVKGSSANPVDLIDLPPGYEEVWDDG